MKFSGRKIYFVYIDGELARIKPRPSMKGGHTHNHVKNCAFRNIFDSKNNRAVSKKRNRNLIDYDTFLSKIHVIFKRISKWPKV